MGLIFPYANTDTMLIHLEHISAKIPPGRHAILVLDQAGWHTTNKIKRFDNITLLPLPPGSPELNPVEQVWEWLKDRELSNRVFKDEEEIIDCSCQAWNNFTDEKGVIQSLCSRSWACL